MAKKTKMVSPIDFTKNLGSGFFDIVGSGDFRLIIHSSTVAIVNADQDKAIHIPKRDFNKLIKFYTTPQKVKQ